MEELALVLPQYSPTNEFHVTRFFPSPKMSVRRGPSVIFTDNLTVCSNRQINGKDFVNICGLFRKHELYLNWIGFGLEKNVWYLKMVSDQPIPFTDNIAYLS